MSYALCSLNVSAKLEQMERRKERRRVAAESIDSTLV